MCEDKQAGDVILEKVQRRRQAFKGKDERRPPKGALQPRKNKKRKILLNPTEETQVTKICAHDNKLDSPNYS